MIPGGDLYIKYPNQPAQLLIPAGNGDLATIIDPYVSFDGRTIYYSRIHDDVNNGAQGTHPSGADVYKFDLNTSTETRLTFQEKTPNTGFSTPVGLTNKGVYNIGPTPLPGGKIMFTSNRNLFTPVKSFTYPLLQLYTMDDDGKNVELIGPMTLGSALHPTIMPDGRVMFSTYESQGFRDRRLWALWSIWPDGRNWGPLMSAFSDQFALHFQTVLSNGRVGVIEYYNQNNNGFGTMVSFPTTVPAGTPAFGDPNPNHPSNPPVKMGALNVKYSTSPYGLENTTWFSIRGDVKSNVHDDGDWQGKVTHPSAAPCDDVLFTYSRTAANDKDKTLSPLYNPDIYMLLDNKPIGNARNLVPIETDPDYYLLYPRALVPYYEIYGVNEPASIPWLPNDGTKSAQLPSGSPFGLVGTSTFYRRNTKPGTGSGKYNGWEPFNTSQNGFSNWKWQGADAGKYSSSDIEAVRILAMEPTSNRGPGRLSGSFVRGFANAANERLRVLGEIPLRKYDSQGNPILDPDGNPDTSFLAKIPADVPYTFQTLDKNGMVLNMAQTWHQARPGEIRNDCGGCHAHSQLPLDFEQTEAAKPSYQVHDLTQLAVQIMSGNTDSSGRPEFIRHNTSDGKGAVEVEYFRDIRPILDNKCVACHSSTPTHPSIPAGTLPGNLDLDVRTKVNGYEGTYFRLCRDNDSDNPNKAAQYGYKPMISAWRQTNASRYIRKFQSRRSMLIWKLYGQRLDGWTNADHPSETYPGSRVLDVASANKDNADIDYTGTMMPPPGSGIAALTAEEKLKFVRWIDLGCIIDREVDVYGAGKGGGAFQDDLRPTLSVATPRERKLTNSINKIQFGAYDYYTRLDRSQISVTANFTVNGRSAGSELADLFAEHNYVWTLLLNSPITSITGGEITVKIADNAGNITEVVRTFDIDVNGDSMPPAPPINLRIF